MKIFKPRQKDVDCEHWCDCYQKAVWVVELEDGQENYYQFFCQEHLDKFVKEVNHEDD